MANPVDILSNLRPTSRSQAKASGSYQLSSYDDNFEAYLSSLGLKGDDLGPMFRSTPLRVVVQEPSKFNKRWNITHREEGENDEAYMRRL